MQDANHEIADLSAAITKFCNSTDLTLDKFMEIVDTGEVYDSIFNRVVKIFDDTGASETREFSAEISGEDFTVHAGLFEKELCGREVIIFLIKNNGPEVPFGIGIYADEGEGFVPIRFSSAQ